jgi:hypothetical protein
VNTYKASPSRCSKSQAAASADWQGLHFLGCTGFHLGLLSLPAANSPGRGRFEPATFKEYRGCHGRDEVDRNTRMPYMWVR